MTKAPNSMKRRFFFDDVAFKVAESTISHQRDPYKEIRICHRMASVDFAAVVIIVILTIFGDVAMGMAIFLSILSSFLLIIGLFNLRVSHFLKQRVNQ